MPYRIAKVTEGKNKGRYRVINRDTGKVHARATSKAKAQKQVRLMLGVEHGMVLRKPTHGS